MARAYQAAAPGVSNVTTSSTELVADNLDRVSLVITNRTGVAVWLGFGATAVVNSGIEIANNDSYTITLAELYTGAINAIHSDSGTKTVGYQEFTK